MIQTLTTTFEPGELKALIADCVSESFRLEVQRLSLDKKDVKEIYTRQEAADILGISLPTLNQYTKQGLIKAYRLGTKVRYKFADINKALVCVGTKSHK